MQKTNIYVAKKSLTFNAEEIQDVLMTLQDKKDDPYATLYGLGIALLYFGLLGANEVRAIEMEDLDLNHRMQEITVKLMHEQKQKNVASRIMYLLRFPPCLKNIEDKSVQNQKGQVRFSS